MKISYLQQLQTLPIEIIQDFRKSGKSQAIAKEIKQYMQELDSVMNIKQEYRFDNISRLARRLMINHPHLSFTIAKERVYDAYIFFHVNDIVSEDIWDAIYADKMEDIAQLCLVKGNEKTAKEALALAHEYRTKGKGRINPEDLKGNIYIISIDIKPEDLGFEPGNLKLIASKVNDGHYIELINSLNVPDAEKKRLKKDARITDAEIVGEENG